MKEVTEDYQKDDTQRGQYPVNVSRQFKYPIALVGMPTLVTTTLRVTQISDPN